MKKFLKQGTGMFDSGTQAAQLIPLYYESRPGQRKEFGDESSLVGNLQQASRASFNRYLWHEILV